MSTNDGRTWSVTTSNAGWGRRWVDLDKTRAIRLTVVLPCTGTHPSKREGPGGRFRSETQKRMTRCWKGARTGQIRKDGSWARPCSTPALDRHRGPPSDPPPAVRHPHPPHPSLGPGVKPKESLQVGHGTAATVATTTSAHQTTHPPHSLLVVKKTI